MKSVLFALADTEKLSGRDELIEVAERTLATVSDPAVWEQTTAENWIYFQPVGSTLPAQGWKLHVSATSRSAAGVLSAVLPTLFAAGCAFKMVRSNRLLAVLNEAHAPRSAAGKFLTIYPCDEEQALRLAEACHVATDGLQGPMILSDRPYRPGSLVHYRYGSFSSQTVFNSEGRLVHVIRDPEGRPVPDTREAWFAPPAWAADPFQRDETGEEGTAAAVLLNGRYEVTRALRHANRGGVYLAADRETGAEVIVKEARPHVCTDRFGRDARDFLRAEAANLERLRASAVTPQPLDLFEQDGHVFLALEKVPGESLRQFRKQNPGPLGAAKILEHARSIASALETCHGAGAIVRDFNPNNLILSPDGGSRVIDLEMACFEGGDLPLAMGGFTPGYASPQQHRGEAPQRTDDLYSLAATLYYLAVGRDPFLLADTPSRRSPRERLAVQLAALVRSGDVPAELEAPILAGLAEVPGERWSAARVLAHLGGHVPAVTETRLPQAGVVASPTSEERRWLEAAHDLAAFGLSSVDLARRQSPIETSCTGRLFDPCIVQHGASGVGVFLTSALAMLGDEGRDTLAGLAGWVADALSTARGRHPGLYFGTGGAAWFLLDAGLALEDAGLAERACALVRSLRPLPGLFDVTHGASGIGMTLLHFHSATGNPEFLAAAQDLAEHVVASAQDGPEGILWPQRDAAGTSTALYGFAHGSAGIAYFLLATHAAGGSVRFLETAEAAADTLASVVEVRDGRAYWAHGPTRPTFWTYWCNGSSGVGTALARVYQVTGEHRYRVLSEQAAAAVYRERWYSGLGHCHGLAGNGEFLLDLHRILGDETYREMAGDLADVLLTHGIHRGGRVVFADDSGMLVSPDYGVGTSGIGAFFHRLAIGGPRLFMVDDVFDAYAGRAIPAVALDAVHG